MADKQNQDFPWSPVLSAGAGVAGGILGMIGQNARARKAHARQKELMGIQFQNQQELNKQGQALQLDMWDKTNYKAQMMQMEKAGLNPSLMYGMSGGGATTSGSQSGGSAQSGNAAAPMDIGGALQAAQLASQIKLTEAQTRNVDAQTESTRGAEGTIGASQIESNQANAMNARSQSELNKLSLEIGNATKEDQIDMVFYEAEGLMKRNGLTDAQIQMENEKILTQGVQRQLMRAGINKSNAEVKKMNADILQGWERIKNDLIGLEIASQGNKIKLLQGKTDLQNVRNNFILGKLGKQIDLMKLNVEQQKIFVSMFGQVLGARGTTETTTQETAKANYKGDYAGGQRTVTTKTRQ